MEGDSPLRVRAVLAAFFLSGAAALVYEVTWTRALSLVLGSTTYALSTMLATFMSGLALGAHWGGKLADRRSGLLGWFGLCELGIGLLGLVSVPLIYGLPAFYLAIYRAFRLHPPVFFVLQVGLCALVMLLPTVLMGATFPLVSRAITGRLEELGRRVGDAYSFNTVGAVVGSLAAGFLLVPALGVKGGAFVAAAVNLAVGLALVAASKPRRLAAAAAIALLYLPAAWWVRGVSTHQAAVNFYTANRYLGEEPYAWLEAETGRTVELVFEGDYAEGALAAYRDPRGDLVLQVAGKPEGTGPNDRAAAHLLAYLPIAAHPEPRDVLVVGLGAGVTTAAAKAHAPRVTVVEIHPGVIEAVGRLRPDVLARVRVVRDDARQYLLKTEERYDVVASAPSYPSEFGVGNLFTVDYYRLVAGRLHDGGLYAQWLPYSLLGDDGVTMMVKTFATVFPHAFLFRVPGREDLVLVGGEKPLARTADEVLSRVAELDPMGGFPVALSRGAAEVAELARQDGVPVNTDDHPILEFRVARNLLSGAGPREAP